MAQTKNVTAQENERRENMIFNVKYHFCTPTDLDSC